MVSDYILPLSRDTPEHADIIPGSSGTDADEFVRVHRAEVTTVFRGTARGGVSVPRSAGFTGARFH